MKRALLAQPRELLSGASRSRILPIAIAGAAAAQAAEDRAGALPAASQAACSAACSGGLMARSMEPTLRRSLLQVHATPQLPPPPPPLAAYPDRLAPPARSCSRGPAPRSHVALPHRLGRRRAPAAAQPERARGAADVGVGPRGGDARGARPRRGAAPQVQREPAGAEAQRGRAAAVRARRRGELPGHGPACCQRRCTGMDCVGCTDPP